MYPSRIHQTLCSAALIGFSMIGCATNPSAPVTTTVSPAGLSKSAATTGTTIDNTTSSVLSPSIGDIATGLVAYYPLDGNALDQSAFANNGTINGPIATIDRFGNENNAMFFNGAGDNIMVNHSASIDIGVGSFTIAAWVKPGSATGNWFDIVAKRSVPGWCLQMCYGPEIKLWTSSDERKGYNFTFQQDVWYFVAAVRDIASGTLTYYINGEASAPMAYSTADESNLANMAIGKLADESHQYFHGAIDELRLYKRALSTEDLDQLYNAANPVTPEPVSVTACPATIWPPNNMMVSVAITPASATPANARYKILGVTCNEAGLADWNITSNQVVELRATRAGTGIGRIYTIEVERTDANGSKITGTVTVSVPHDQDTK